ncbi:gamma-glutamyl-gamma-aminobutyrate hydrolase family protein [Pseudohalocynthiibacter aestuariivivens]|nr:gamma-glutamyl-gamma-aminobutyrate hydrolase family protein [Pseudohalocynthiibacter aestuariivivens]QIE44215.1 gamma-glutamyl-gamma-aminobutyrate hydrolase family protein [Pseudohalocynthiibacter aestuariivivens]
MTKPPLIAVTSNFNSAKNEYYLLAPYVEAVSKAGGQPVMLPYCYDGDLVQYASRFDGVVFTGGTDFSPDYYGGQHHSEISEVLSNRDGFEFEFAKAVLKSGMPVLGICRGMQLVNVLRGGTIFDHTLDQRP